MIKNIKRLAQKINDSFIIKVIICTILCFMVIISFLIINNKLDINNFHKYRITSDTGFVNAIENVYIDNNEIQLEGYAFLIDKNTDSNLISVFLRSVTTKNEIWLNVTQVDRNDVSDYFKSEYNYTNSGFVATAKSKAINTDEVYEIILNIDYNEAGKKVRKTVTSNRYILGDELYSYNPHEFDNPSMNVKSELLKEVFANGQLCMYLKEEGIYVYQYDDKLFWIATENFKESKSINIIYHLYTSQIDKLPEHRIQYKFDNLDFYFDDFEYLDEDTEPYRIAIRDIPKEYAITYIQTGMYDAEINKNLWTRSFLLNAAFYTE